jgi:hypothetical protein
MYKFIKFSKFCFSIFLSNFVYKYKFAILTLFAPTFRRPWPLIGLDTEGNQLLERKREREI